LVEFVLVLPVLLIVFVAIIEMTRLLSIYAVMVEASSDAAYYWTRLDNQAMTGVKIQELLRTNLQVNGVDTSGSGPLGTSVSQTGTDVDGNPFWSVTVRYVIQPITPIEIQGTTLFDSTFEISTTGSIAVEKSL
jgi:Flp pilus assembly protein TadG